MTGPFPAPQTPKRCHDWDPQIPPDQHFAENLKVLKACCLRVIPHTDIKCGANTFGVRRSARESSGGTPIVLQLSFTSSHSFQTPNLLYHYCFKLSSKSTTLLNSKMAAIRSLYTQLYPPPPPLTEANLPSQKGQSIHCNRRQRRRRI